MNALDRVRRLSSALVRTWVPIVASATVATACVTVALFIMFVVFESQHVAYDDYNVALAAFVLLMSAPVCGGMYGYLTRREKYGQAIRDDRGAVGDRARSSVRGNGVGAARQDVTGWRQRELQDSARQARLEDASDSRVSRTGDESRPDDLQIDPGIAAALDVVHRARLHYEGERT